MFMWLICSPKDNPQQVERKRHIGNDIVCFQEEDDEFDPTCSILIGLYASVTYKKKRTRTCCVFNEESVPPYGPEIMAEYTDHVPLRRVLLVQANERREKAVYETPQFVARRNVQWTS